MAAKYILATLAGAFLIAGAVRRVSGDRGPQSRTWLLVGAIFAVVSLWLFLTD
jgi:NO-binding membrane sensor protein with MHYT domain